MPSGNLSDLIFSEYVEGSSNNKALEIFNGTGTAIDLTAAGYKVEMYFNGSSTVGRTINLAGTVAPGDVFVLALNNNSNPALLTNADQIDINQSWYNGNDAVVLRRGTTIVDSIGQIGFDPGTEWGTGLISTQDNTLTRNRNATGDTNPNDTFTPSSEWKGFLVDTFNGLGSYYSAPVLNNATSATLTAINEDIADTSNTGTKLSDLIGSAITDINNDPQGIAVTGVDNSNGTWQYSLNGGGTWLDFGAVSDTSATLLGWTTLYTSQSGTAPGSQGLGYTSLGTATQTVGSGATTLSTLASSSTSSGYTSTATTLDRSKGYKINFSLKINSEDHSPSSAQKNSDQDAIADRAGFSIIAVSSDGRKAVEIGFWNNEIWVQDDGVTASNGRLFTHNTSTERYFGDTTVLTNYSLSVLGDNYTLYANGTAVLSGLLRDYSAFTHPFLDVYETPNFIFLGDDTTSASGSFDLTRVAVQTAEPLVRFVPNADYDGTANLTFRAWDGTDRISSGTTGVNASTGGGTSAFSNNSNVATITINPINDAPVLNNTGNPVFNTINEDVPLVSNNGTLISTLLATGAGSNPITDVDTGAVEGIAVVGVDNTNGIWQYSTDGSTWTDFSVSATSATLLKDTARIRFVPNADFNGIVTNGISFRAWDTSDGLSSGTTGINPGVGGGTTAFSTATETAKITITAVNDAPTVTAISDQVINEDTATGAIAFTIGDVETLPGNLVVTATSSNTTLIPNANITFTGTGSDRSLVVTPNPNQFGTATITLNVSDGTTTTTETFQVVVNGVNDEPTITAISDQVTNEDTPTNAISFTIGDAETSPENLLFIAASSDTTLIPNGNISVTGTGATRQIVVTPAANQFGTATIILNVSDGTQITSSSFEVDVNPVNDAPNFTPGSDQIVYAGAGEQTVTGWASGFNPGATNESNQEILNYLVNVTNNASIFATAPTIDAATGNLIYTPVDTLTSSTTATIAVRVRDDGGTANGGVNTSTIQTFTITVNPTVVSITALDGNADESGDTGIYKIERVGETDNALAVKLQIDNSSSTTSGDYTLSDSNGNAIAFSNGIATVTLEPGQTSVNVILTPVDDTLPELAETLKLNLASGGYKIDTTNNNATVTIAANDSIQYSVEASNSSLTEGNSSSQLVTYTITRSGGIGAASTINYALNGTATNGSDYNNIRVTGGGTSPSGTLSFAAGETTKTVKVNVLGDIIDEADEDITLTLSNAESATVTIIDDDPSPKISISNVTLTEGNNGTTLANFLVSLDRASSQLITVDYATNNDTATSPNDYVNATTGTLNFNPGVTQQIISIAVVGDFVDESNETFLVNLSNPSNNATLLDSQGVGTINDNDTAGFTLSPINGNTTEGGGTASFTIKLNSQPTSDVTLNFSSSDPTEGQVVTPSLTFTAANWNINQTVTIRGVDDSLLDGNIAYNIITAAAVSNDIRYNNLNPNDVSVTNTDNEIQLRVINGTRRSDSIIGTARNEQINGLGGHDTIIGGYGSDRLYGNDGNDILIGDTSNLLVGDLRCGDDVIFGGTGSDRIYGGGGNDLLYGEAGDDWISGDNGSDRLSGGLGNDILTGGLGQDKFILARGEGIDTIRDFQLGQDAIALSTGLSFNQLSITQRGSQTSIIDTTTNQTLALLTGVNAATLISQAPSSFVTL